MIIKTLVENTSISGELETEHGLSLYIETKKQKILFDVGESEIFLQNARKLGVNIADVESLVISHGHYDHGGGLKAFLRENTKAKIFIQQLAFGKHYAARPNDELKYIGIDETLKQNERIEFVSDRLSISEGVEIFSNIVHRGPLPTPNKGLLMERDGEILPDTFAHEQILAIEEDGKTLLLTGCAHNGIVNIVEHFRDLKGRMPDYVIGGFHLSSPSSGLENPETIDGIGRYLIDTGAKYYTCHCTGIEPYERLKAVMGEKIEYLSAGRELTI